MFFRVIVVEGFLVVRFPVNFLPGTIVLNLSPELHHILHNAVHNLVQKIGRRGGQGSKRDPGS